jgi:hypothetical protein
MPERYWLVHPDGGRQLIDPHQLDLERLAEHARRIGGRLVIEHDAPPSPAVLTPASSLAPAPLLLSHEARAALRRYEPPIAAVEPLFRLRLNRIYSVLCEYELDINIRPTTRVLGGYYKTRRLVRVYSHDQQLGRRPLEELFDTFLHEVAHHIEYTEPDSFHARSCGRIPGRMHSRLFWRILGELKDRWADLQRGG